MPEYQSITRGQSFYPAPEIPAPEYMHYGELGCSFISLSQPTGEPAVNYIRNPSFERNRQGWDIAIALGTTLLRTATGPFSGTFGLRVTAPPGAQPGDQYGALYGAGSIIGSPFPQISVAVNQRVYGGIWVRGEPGDTIAVQLIFDGIAVPGYINNISNPPTLVSATGEWQFVRATFSTRAAGSTVGLMATSDNGSGAGLFFVDGAIISTNDVQFFDGDSFGATWAGAPHASESNASQFAALGQPINLTDLGVDVISYEGFGVPPVENISTSFARQHGSHFQRQRFLPRTMTITLDVQDCSLLTGVQQARCDLIDAIFGYKFRETCRFDLILYWTFVNSCCEALSRTVAIPVQYEGGLEGSTGHLWRSRIALQFTAYEQLFWQDVNTTSSVIIPVSPSATRPVVDGNQPAYPIIQVVTGADPMTLTRVINDTGGVAIGIGVPTLGYTVPANSVLRIDTNPLTFEAIQIDSAGTVTDLRTQINFPASNLGEFLMIPGTNNLRLDAGSVLPATASANVTWRNNYLGVECAPLTKEC